MAENVSAVSRAISDELTGAYTKRRLTQEAIARETDMPLVTVVTRHCRTRFGC